MADVICRWRNATPQTICELVDLLPHESMRSDDFRNIVGSGFFRTPYQFACQLGLYFEADEIYHPRFKCAISQEEAKAYLEFWIHRYYAPNPYTKSLKTLEKPVYLVGELVKYLQKYDFRADLRVALTNIFKDPMGNVDIITNVLNNYSKVIKVKDGIAMLDPNFENILSYMPDRNDKKAFFDNFNLREENKPSRPFSLQQIYYGAPGTGKSHSIKERTQGKATIRTTFHPDSDYSTFVGAYKPTTVVVPVTTVIGTKAVAVEDANGRPQTEKKIEYRFVAQAFLQAYVAAWVKYAKAEGEAEPEDQILVIEEINRGNCAQIFGDLFQLLDRADSGFSEYPIEADADMRSYLREEFAKRVGALSDDKKATMGNLLGDSNLVERIFAGEALVLPCNLYIWATMNTSDQSLFPIDSAFKRRWDWQYVPISDAGLDYAIKVRSRRYSWWSFLQKVNAEVYKATFSEDKQLGYFFCKANKSHDIDVDTFVGKVVFYLWNDVFKDYEFASPIFRDGDNGKLSFDKFYIPNGTTAKVAADKVEIFLQNLGVEMIGDDDNDADEAGGENAEEPRVATETDNI